MTEFFFGESEAQDEKIERTKQLRAQQMEVDEIRPDVFAASFYLEQGNFFWEGKALIDTATELNAVAGVAYQGGPNPDA